MKTARAQTTYTTQKMLAQLQEVELSFFVLCRLAKPHVSPLTIYLRDFVPVDWTYNNNTPASWLKGLGLRVKGLGLRV